VDTQAKLLAKELLLAAPASKNGGSKGRSRSLGAPTIKPGKSRRHGGYGIGGEESMQVARTHSL